MTTIRRVIFIDDNDDDNVYHARILKRAAFDGELLVFEEGRSALTFLESADLTVPTVIFLDVNMPEMSGFEVAVAARPLVLGTVTSIIMLTSSSSSADRARADGVDVIRGYLTKPLTLTSVGEVLRAPPMG